MEGVVIRSTGSWYNIWCQSIEAEITARLKGSFRQDESKFTNPIAVGDMVVMTHENGDYIIDEIKDRRNYIVRQSPKHRLAKHIIASNIDQAALIVSIQKPRTSSGFIDRFITTAEAYNIPVVFFDRIPTLKNIHYVACNMETGTIQALNYLIKKGHRAIGLINGPVNMYASTERRDGYINALLKSRLKFDPSLVINCDLTKKDVELAMDKILKNKRKVTAVVTFNDYVALYAINYLRHNNMNLSEEIVFVSYSNLPLIQYMHHVPVASVEQYPYKQGQKATEILLNILKQKNDESTENEAFYKVIIESNLIENSK
jgi:LacI family transcriptional regulator